MARAWWRIVLAGFAAIGPAAAPAVGDDGFPYIAYVGVDQAEVLSGPGHRYYATQLLPLGTEVEVYREEASGWLAIRPPAGDFSWLPADAVERTSDSQVGRVLEATGAWIGTIAEHVDEHRTQVTLQTGELVKILGEKTVAHGGEEQVWLKIAPPAGEFRWIHLRDVSRQKPATKQTTLAAEDDRESVSESDDEASPPVALDAGFDRAAELAESLRGLREALTQAQGDQEVATAKRVVAVEPAEPRRFEAGEGAIPLSDIETNDEPTHRLASYRRPQHSGIETVQFKSGVDDSARPSLSPDGFVPRKRHGSSQQLDTVPVPSPRITQSTPPLRAGSTGGAVRSDMRLARATPEVPSRHLVAPGSGTDAEAIDRQLDQIEVELSLMLAQDKSLWDLGGLKARVSELVERGSDPVARGRARLVLEKIEEFAEAFDVNTHTALTSAPAAPAAGQASGASLADPRYDGEGWLKPVISRKGDTPPAPYALVDGEGKPRCFVTPSPGLNLNRYLNKQVGVYGRRGYIESLKTPHVVVERAIDLERQWR